METIYTLIEYACYGVIYACVYNIVVITIEEIEKEYF